MKTAEELADENRRLRRTMRDLVALSTLPAVWVGLPVIGVVRGLADALLNTLSLDLVYVRLTSITGSDHEVVRARKQEVTLDVVRPLIDQALTSDEASAPAIADFLDGGRLHLAVTRFGVGASHGVLVTGSHKPDFPTERDRLLLGVGANQTAIVIQRRRAEDQQKLAVEQLREADLRKNEFLAMLAHELRNPLAPIRTGLHVLKLAGDGPSADEARMMMDRQLAQMVRLVDDLMDVSRITSGKIELRKEPVNVAAVIQSAIETTRPLIAAMGHELTVALPAEPVTVDADFTRLAQVLVNLLNNAAKYNERGGRIALTAQRREQEVVISVKDDGIGIDAKHLPTIFEMFSQADRSLEKAQGGLGIGLTLVKRLVEMHGGTVEARSEGRNRGTELLVRLPIIHHATAAVTPHHQQPSRALPLRILIVDDNEDGADLLGFMLSSMGNEIRIAYDGEEAVMATADFQPDVVLLDLGLPKLNGYDACRRIRSQSGGEERVLIAQTGWGQSEDRQRTREAGFDHHLVKPIDPDVLQKLLADVCPRAHAR